MARRKNISRRAAIVGVSLLGASLAVVAGVALARTAKKKKKKKVEEEKRPEGEPEGAGGLPPPPPPTGPAPESLPYPQPVQTPEGLVCQMGPQYPGYIVELTEGLGGALVGKCVPGDETPRGYYVHSACADFDFAVGKPAVKSAQTNKLTEIIERGSKLTGIRRAAGKDDPTAHATEFLQTFWPECTWPPRADDPERIVQLFEALAIQIGRVIHNSGGVVLGTRKPEKVDDRIFDRLAQIGLPPFDNSVVPEVFVPAPPTS